MRASSLAAVIIFFLVGILARISTGGFHLNIGKTGANECAAWEGSCIKESQCKGKINRTLTCSGFRNKCCLYKN
ncbi:hypothetical protein V5799_018546 [Amblyomma americanum]|uniref:Secreted protein n=1 Tax=Amblyomma americanum TaxID=6943 RepID=A0AAQ4F019_AMBAM